MTTTAPYLFEGRQRSTDRRDRRYPLAALLPEDPPDRPRHVHYWWADGAWPDVYNRFGRGAARASWEAWLADERSDPAVLDGLPDESADSIRDVASFLRGAGVIEAYHWSTDAEVVIRYVNEVGPVVVGSDWHEHMAGDTKGMVGRASSRSGASLGSRVGELCYLVNGVNFDRETVRIKPPFGRHWGSNGFAYVPFEDFAGLLGRGGEACAGVLARP